MKKLSYCDYRNNLSKELIFTQKVDVTFLIEGNSFTMSIRPDGHITLFESRLRTWCEPAIIFKAQVNENNRQKLLDVAYYHHNKFVTTYTKDAYIKRFELVQDDSLPFRQIADEIFNLSKKEVTSEIN